MTRGALGVILGGSDAFDKCPVAWYRRGSAVPTYKLHQKIFYDHSRFKGSYPLATKSGALASTRRRKSTRAARLYS